MNEHDITSLDGKQVMVIPAHEEENPPVGMRGTLQVSSNQNRPELSIRLEFPIMFDAPARIQILEVPPEAIAKLIASESSGTYIYQLPGELKIPAR